MESLTWANLVVVLKVTMWLGGWLSFIFVLVGLALSNRKIRHKLYKHFDIYEHK